MENKNTMEVEWHDLNHSSDTVPYVTVIPSGLDKAFTM